MSNTSHLVTNDTKQEESVRIEVVDFITLCKLRCSRWCV